MLLQLEEAGAGEVGAGARLAVDPLLPLSLEDDEEDEKGNPDDEGDAERGHDGKSTVESVRRAGGGVERPMRTTRLAATLALLFLASAAEVAMATEEPKHLVLETRDGFEVRLYEQQVVAETVVEGEFGGGGNEGFRRIAGYIFGGNDGGRKIAMTAPVAQEERLRRARRDEDRHDRPGGPGKDG